jgi:hypothetical protein
VAEREVLPRDEMTGAETGVQHFPDEVIRRHQAKFMIEWQLV